MTPLSFTNLATYSTQIAFVVLVAAIGAPAVRLSAPVPRLAYWRAVVAVCLLLPLWPARRVDAVAPSATFDPRGTVALAATATTSPGTTPLSLLPWLLLSGTVARGTWLGIGLTRLRRLRLRSVAAALDRDIEALRVALAPGAELRWDEHVGQPLTFGLWRPVVLLPRRLTDLPPAAQRAVICHELLHVARRDWAWTLLEESVQTIFWFHPAIWWALGQAQLAREETVDARVVAITTARQAYMNALMMFAEARPALASAIPYVRRRHLASRIKQLHPQPHRNRHRHHHQVRKRVRRSTEGHGRHSGRDARGRTESNPRAQSTLL